MTTQNTETPPETTNKTLAASGVGLDRASCSVGCLSCQHCGPKLRQATSPIGEVFQIIRCDHPDWEDEDTTMREIDSEFGGECSEFELNANLPDSHCQQGGIRIGTEGHDPTCPS